MQNKIYSLQKEVDTWKNDQKPGLLQITFTLVTLIMGAINSNIDEITPPILQAVLWLLLILAAVVIGYLVRRAITPTYIKELEREIEQIKEQQLMQGYLNK